MAFETPGLDAVAQKVGQGLDFLINDCIIGKLGGFLDEKSAVLREKISSAVDTASASISGGIDSAKNMVGLGDKGGVERGEPGLARSQEISPSQSVGRSADSGLGTKGMDQQIAQATVNCDWAKSCQVQTVDAHDIGQLPPAHTIAQVQTKGQGMAMA